MNQEALDANAMYKELMTQAGAAGTFCPFRKEFQMEVIESLLEKEWGQQEGLEVFEACSGQGRLLHYLRKFSPKQNYTGLDYIPEHVAQANERFKGASNVSCVVGDVYRLPKTFEKRFDYSFLYKTLYVLPDAEQALRELIRATKRKIYITTPFYSGDIDFEVRIRSRRLHKEDQYVGYYIRGVPGFLEACARLGAKQVALHDLNIPFDLPRSSDPGELRTHTERLDDGSRLELTGIVVLDWKLCVIDV